MRGRD